MSLLEVRDLAVSYDGRRAVEGVSFTVEPGEVVAVVGESGSGKSTTAHAIIGLLPGNAAVESGRVLLGDADLATWSQRRLRTVRGARVGLVPQDPSTSLDPVKTVGAQIGEVLRLHGRRDRREVRARVLDLLARVGLPDPETRARQYPHELSGGMRQRVLIAIAIALGPSLIIADEPTSALDATVQRRILDLLDDLRAESGTAVLLVTHDLGVAAGRSDHLVVMKDGGIVEQGRTSEVLAAPRAEYTRRLLADAPALSARPFRDPPAADEPAVVVRDLVREFRVGRRPFRAVDGVSFEVARGTTHALVGESGSGKTTTARTVVRFARPTSGTVTVTGAPDGRGFRRHVQLVHQNPYGSLDPRQTVGEIVEEPLRNFGAGDRATRRARVADLVERVALPEDVLTRRPRELSGGQRQRVAIARALAAGPELLVLDEAVSALDVTVQAQILDLLDGLQRELGLTYLFISHDLAVVRQISHTVSVMNEGRIVETGTTRQVFTDPRHPYTRELLAAIPEPVR
ncbi:dipeptide ABC transporter ATP-binding protein [Nonomuraea pusilla]|uniref:Peptide/nickel transport system ATP-binding protein n=1 Tax=Nonomuraea pusilla TaxID=46177 RepID=A0A1H7T1S6_9ACTN|nr:ABC transporter ATP-binding protein [Nonomuraea pusilla]SEL78204.1 peptide/nickel transport system ATP-binding protein [Nonomuraea pusilla]